MREFIQNFKRTPLEGYTISLDSRVSQIHSQEPNRYGNEVKVSVKENEVPTEKNSSRASIFATKASYISN